ncbi:HEAT repeat domain-containing protein [Bacillus sp. KH172YL63]|uniref:HEAT repeat domain-containing protein n=1 Tax=Bacillus sp. KH172YL63 TaxID=2709784 RepID=UPI0013E4DB12|nr:HEAT repeat domain-containing protein [Bacillus sp. KH172YL63]BCB05615.1 hypothetical protein KH172YL63_37480 [Bacillus sp. KH172YL63]
MFRTEIFYFSIGLISLLSLLILLFLYLIAKKAIENNKRKRVEEYKEAYRLKLFHYINENKEEAFPAEQYSPLQLQALVELLAGYSKAVASEDLQERIQQFADRHFTDFIQSGLKHRRWSIRMNALYWVGDFKMKSMISQLEEVHSSSRLTKGEELQLLKIGILLQDESIVEKMMDPVHDLTEFEYSTLFQSLNHEQFTYLLMRFTELSDRMKHAMIDAIGLRNQIELGDLLEEKLEDPSLEIRIRSLKALVEMEYYIPLPKLNTLLQSESWQVRLMAIKACEYIRTEELTASLIALMGDRSYYVRSQAAQALLRADKGRGILEGIAATAEDDYARDMAEQWLERGMPNEDL